jgi:flagellar hook assembly protein FlgD
MQLGLFSPDSTAVVRQLMNADGFVGYYTINWDGRDDSAAPVPDGRYPYTLVATDIATQALLFTDSKAVTVRCVTGAETPPWSAVKSLFR